jgi:activator of 2-hydroxyglutaryl-CoA dehydratase
LDNPYASGLDNVMASKKNKKDKQKGKALEGIVAGSTTVLVLLERQEKIHKAQIGELQKKLEAEEKKCRSWKAAFEALQQKIVEK